jgi:hypothetical protein
MAAIVSRPGRRDEQDCRDERDWLCTMTLARLVFEPVRMVLVRSANVKRQLSMSFTAYGLTHATAGMFVVDGGTTAV